MEEVSRPQLSHVGDKFLGQGTACEPGLGGSSACCPWTHLSVQAADTGECAVAGKQNRKQSGHIGPLSHVIQQGYK